VIILPNISIPILSAILIKEEEIKLDNISDVPVDINIAEGSQILKELIESRAADENIQTDGASLVNTGANISLYILSGTLILLLLGGIKLVHKLKV
jgi:hypothetical protein